MTHPIRIKVHHLSKTPSEKPPAMNMRCLIIDMFFKLCPCFRLINRDEKVPLTPQNNMQSNQYYE